MIHYLRNILLLTNMMIAFSSYSLDSVWELGDSIPGRRADNPIRIQMEGSYFELTDSADTFDWVLQKFYPETVHYVIDIPEPMMVMITTHGSLLRNIDMRVGHILAPTDTIWFEPIDTGDWYVDYLIDSDAWDSERDARTQAFWNAEMKKGRYAVEINGVYTQEQGTSNGLIVTSFIGNTESAGLVYPPVPKILQKGMRWYPDSLGLMPANTNYNIYHRKELNEQYLGVRQDFDGKIYHYFVMADTLDMTFSTYDYGTQLWIWPNDSTIGDLSEHPSDTDAWPIYCPPENAVKRRMLPGKYMLAASDTLDMTAGTRLGFLIDSKEPLPPPPPPPPPEWTQYAYSDTAVAGHNYVREIILLNETESEYRETINFYDGLGRPSQILITSGSPEGSDIVTHNEYDLSGRMERQWLPTVNNGNGQYIQPSLLDYNMVYKTEQTPYSSTQYEASPLNRETKSRGPGDRWVSADKSVNTEYLFNNSGYGELSCLYLKVNPTPDSPNQPIVVTCGYSDKNIYYSPYELHVTRVTSEDGNVTLTFTNARGQTVLSRQLIDGTFADTYYVYDIYGNLTAVIPPEAATRISGAMSFISGQSEILDDYCYLYTFDKLGQMTSKKLPGCDKILYRYDKTGRQYLSQDGVLRRQGLWRFYIADAFGRECLTGTCSSMTVNDSDGLVRARRNGNGSQRLMGYSIDGADITEPRLLSVTYYDDYSFIGSDGLPAVDKLGFVTTNNVTDHYPNAKGQMTGRLTAVPVSTESDSLEYMASAFYYDYRDRLIQTVAQNRIGGFDRTSTLYDFVGQPIASDLIHTAFIGDSASTVTQQWKREFDRQGRELSVAHSINSGQWHILSEKSYDMIGRLSTESVGSPESGIIRTYEYDVRSHPVSISSNIYSQQLDFTYGGNVSKMTWQTADPYDTERTYDFLYDSMSRLISAKYSDANGISGWFDTSYSYDLNGNITTLQRNGLYDNSVYGYKYGLIDNLSYEYHGNQAIRISDSCSGPYYQGAYHFRDEADEAVEYTYDANGNTTSDLNRGISAIRYDHNNRPRDISFDSGASTRYIYSNDGVKLQTVHRTPTISPAAGIENIAAESTVTSVTDYCGPFIYENGALTRINLDNGYLSYRSVTGQKLDAPEYIFYLRDHLGNNRVTLRGNDNEILQTDHYYPFGLPMGCGYNTSFQQWRFGGKELDRTAGLDLYDFEARALDPATCRFTTMDPLCENYNPISSYVYCANNPLRNIDPTGMFSLENIKSGEMAPVICIYPDYNSNEKERDNIITHDYQAAQKAGMPIILVTDMTDFANALSELKEMGVEYSTVTINSHGEPGSFKIGFEKVNPSTDFSILKDGLEDKNVFIGACNVGKNSTGRRFTENAAEDTQSTIITAENPLLASYKYNGMPIKGKPKYVMKNMPGNSYIMSHKGADSVTIYGLFITKQQWFYLYKNTLPK